VAPGRGKGVRSTPFGNWGVKRHHWGITLEGGEGQRKHVSTKDGASWKESYGESIFDKGAGSLLTKKGSREGASWRGGRGKGKVRGKKKEWRSVSIEI